MEEKNKSSVKVIAFYLPQYHAIPENDKAYGKGFTEWTNTRKAEPLFDGHYQPRIPYNDNYYCLLDDGIMEKQAKLAQEYGVYGFCYYHYWFKNGKKLLEKPLERMLKNPDIDIPFCLCWANENWTKRWDGGNNEVIVEQDYGNMKDLDAHIDYLCEFFLDKRYIRIDDKPLLLIYKPELIPNLDFIVRRIREKVCEKGFKGIKLIVQYPKYYFDGIDLNLFDNYIQFQPAFIRYKMNEDNKSAIKKGIKKLLLHLKLETAVKTIQKAATKRNLRGSSDQPGKLLHRSYVQDWEEIINYKVMDSRMIAGAFVDWDNTPRNKTGLVYDGASPKQFSHYMHRLVQKVRNEYKEPYIFLNAWNEWAEGAYLEPDKKYGYSYLKALKKSIEDVS